MNEQGLKSDHTEQGVTAAVKGIVTSLLLGIKMLSLYPRSHTNSKQALARFHSGVTSFVAEHGDLGLQVEKGALLYEGEVVYKGTARDGDPVFCLFRDGVQWLQFEEGIEPWESETFLNILHQYNRLHPEAEDDLVTALWENQLPHIHYDAVENLLEGGLLGEAHALIDAGNRMGALHGGNGGGKESSFNPFVAGVMPKMSCHAPAQGSDAGETCHIKNFKASRRMSPDAFDLTAEEVALLQRMVLDDEESDPTQEVLDMLVDILHDRKEKEFFDVVLEFLREELGEALITGQFETAGKILHGLHHIRRLSEEEKTWALPLIQEVLHWASSPESLGVLQTVLFNCDERQLDEIKRILLLLPPESIRSLGPILAATSFPPAQEMLAEVIGLKAAEDIRPIESLLNFSSENLIPWLVAIVGKLEGQKPVEMLLKMTRHASEPILKGVLEIFMKRDVWAPRRLFRLITHESVYVRHLLLKYLGSRKCETTERLLLDYLEEIKDHDKDSGHLFACFRTLGLCGSDRSIPFLRRTLMGGSWISKFSSSHGRCGAAIALRTLGTENALHIIEEASQSLFPGVRRAARRMPGLRSDTGDNQ